jgi:Glycosyl hydrolase family 12/Cellulose binding domain
MKGIREMQILSVRRRAVAASFFTVALVISSFVSIGLVSAATGQICTQYGTTTQGNYLVMNNRWGTSATQCINVTASGFQIVQQDGTGNLSGAPTAYPAIYLGCHYSVCSPNSPLPMQISKITSATSSTTETYPSSGTYDAAYDIWLNDTTNVTGVQKTEIMIWLNHTGSIQPIGSQTATASIAGHSWAVWTGNNGSNNVVSYQSAGITSLSFNVMSFINDTLSRGSQYGNSSWYLTSIQDGFEPWIGGVGLAVSNFSASVSGSGGGTTPTPTATPVRTGATPTPTATPVRTGATPTPVRTATPTAAGTGSGSARCSASFAYASQWNNGFTANFTVSNPGTVATKTWRVTWTWNGNQSIVNSWNASVTSSGASVTANNLSYNGAIAAGGNTAFGLQAGFSGSITAPTLSCSAT